MPVLYVLERKLLCILCIVLTVKRRKNKVDRTDPQSIKTLL